MGRSLTRRNPCIHALQYDFALGFKRGSAQWMASEMLALVANSISEW